MIERKITVNGEALTVVFGEYINGNFCACPVCGWACDLGDFDDAFYNAEKLNAVTDGDTAKAVLAELSKMQG